MYFILISPQMLALNTREKAWTTVFDKMIYDIKNDEVVLRIEIVLKNPTETERKLDDLLKKMFFKSEY